MATGTIARWSGRRGFGLITPDDSGEAVFAHITQVRSLAAPNVSDRVTFEIKIDPTGDRTMACNIRIIRNVRSPRSGRDQQARVSGRLG